MEIVKTNKGDKLLQKYMKIHYSQPRGFVGRQLFYRIEHEGVCYGCIAWGSATKHLPGREIVGKLNNGMNNIFYHVERPEGKKYPLRNFTTTALLLSETRAIKDYEDRYKDTVNWLETLVEPPRTGDLYLKAGYTLVGKTKGFTCKRVSGPSTDGWAGRRVWDYNNLRPKLVFYKIINSKAEATCLKSH